MQDPLNYDQPGNHEDKDHFRAECLSCAINEMFPIYVNAQEKVFEILELQKKDQSNYLQIINYTIIDCIKIMIITARWQPEIWKPSNKFFMFTITLTLAGYRPGTADQENQGKLEDGFEDDDALEDWQTPNNFEPPDPEDWKN